MPRNDKGNSVLEARRWLGAVGLGEPAHHGSLTVFPLFLEGSAPVVEPSTGNSPSWPSGDAGGNGSGPRYELLSDAIDAGTARVEEVSEGGQVPFLGVRNDGRLPILVPEGEVLAGAKQNRAVNLTVLVAAGSTFKLPVSCVEQGRWRYMSRHFRPAAFAHPKLRELKMKSAQRSRSAVGMPMADQGAVWDEVDSHLHAIEAPSPTRSMTDAYETAGERVREHRRRVTLPDDACGFLVARGTTVVGMDLFDVPTTLKKLWPRMADAYFIEALLEGDALEASPREVAESFLAEVTRSLVTAEVQPELGVELELAEAGAESPGLGPVPTGSALWYQGAVCHLSAFSV